MNNQQQTSNGVKKLSIIIPVYNEDQTVEEIVRRVSAVSISGYEKEIIVVNDGSNDGTKRILIHLKTNLDFTLLEHDENLGKGAAVKTALGRVTGDAVLIQDADLEYDPNDYRELLKAFDGRMPVYGSRNLGKAERGHYLFFWGGKLLTTLFNLLFGAHLTDINTGYKLFSADVIKSIPLESNGFEFCEEITAKVCALGYTIKEIPIHYSPRSFSEGKKIRAVDGLIALGAIIKYRFL